MWIVQRLTRKRARANGASQFSHRLGCASLREASGYVCVFILHTSGKRVYHTKGYEVMVLGPTYGMYGFSRLRWECDPDGLPAMPTSRPRALTY